MSLAAVRAWLEEHQPPRHPVLAYMEEFAARGGIPIVGPAIGRFHHQMALTIGAKRVFQFGTVIGYTSLWLAFAVGKEGMVTVAEEDLSNEERAQDFVARAGMADRVSFVPDNALEVLSQGEKWDIIHVDLRYAASKSLSIALDVASDRIRTGGLLIADNVFLGGRGLDVLSKSPDPAEDSVRTFTRSLLASRDLLASIIPLGDGLAVGLRVDP